MGKELLKFGEVKFEKQEFHSSKSAITINNIHNPQKVAIQFNAMSKKFNTQFSDVYKS